MLAFAASASGVRAMQIEPATLDLIGEPGQAVKASFVVTNQEANAQRYYFSLQKFVPQGETGDVQILPSAETSGLPSWTYLAVPSVLLGPGQSERIGFEVRLPVDAPRGSQQEVLFVSTAAPQGAGIGVGIRTGIFVFVRIGQEQNQALRIAHVDAAPNWISHLPLEMNVTLENQGAAYEIPEGSLRITNWLGAERVRLPFNRVHGRVLPNARRRFQEVWQNHAPGSDQRFWSQVGEELSNGGFGRYTVTFEPAGRTSLPRTTLFSVWIWPVHVLAVLAGVVILLCLMLWTMRRVLIRRFMRSSV